MNDRYLTIEEAVREIRGVMENAVEPNPPNETTLRNNPYPSS